MGSQAIQIQWGLNEAVNQGFSFTKGFLEAMTSDNVQPLAIVVCEQFGNTIAISRETLLKIEKTVLPTPEPATIQFLKAWVGFKKNDCAVHLGSNQAGLRFLALAAALLSSIDLHRCAEVLTAMLEATKSNAQLLPTQKQLFDLMSSLAGRCRQSGFGIKVIGYASLFTQKSAEKGYDYSTASSVPDEKGLLDLVDACRQLQRVGDDSIKSIIVKARDCAAWVAAFAGWSLEVPPSIYFADGTPILSQPGSQLELHVMAESEVEYDLEVIRELKFSSIKNLIGRCSSHDQSIYAVDVQTYGTLLLESYCDQKLVADAVMAALPFTIRKVCGSIYVAPGSELRGRASTVLSTNPQGPKGTGPFTARHLKPFHKRTAFMTMSLLFDLKRDFPFDSSASVKSLGDLPEVKEYLRMSGSGGTHASPSNLTIPRWWARKQASEENTSRQIDPLSTTESIESLFEKLGAMCAFILLLSLFDGIEGLLFSPPPSYLGGSDSVAYGLQSMIQPILRNEQSDMEFPGTVLDLCDFLVEINGDGLRNTDPLVVSTATHVFWPSMIDNWNLDDGRCFRIASSLGRLMYKGETFDTVLCQEPNYPKSVSIRNSLGPVNAATENLWLNVKTRWRLTLHRGKLYADLALVRERDSGTVIGNVDPIAAMRALRFSQLVNCDHLANTPVERHERGHYYVAAEEVGNEEWERLNILPVAGIGDLQMFCLGLAAYKFDKANEFKNERNIGYKPIRIGVREKACLECCINFCNIQKTIFLIL
ncbi:hypothetical protein F4802DRAFT_591735 [Xylaria palmicola]|nr:hypothetical protein F4802DRAFT_591735 [Xylaria palmicola]